MMRWVTLVGAAFLSIGTAWAQSGGSEIVIPPAPPLVPEVPSPPTVVPAQPVAPPPPGLEQASPPSDDSTVQSPASVPLPNAATQPPPPDVAPTAPNNWMPGATAMLGVLNKVDGSTAQLQLSVGGQAQTSGDLSVSVQACLSRPAGQIPDAAVFLTVTPVQQGASPLYRGWMLRSAPGATFVGNAGETFRIIGCS